ncbi:hypothetical protein [uncultured Aquimonas sp.]|uniref:hypothetical protein n=1 Tax=uncultured Aquimonas sp. TaxID=385483 RepID=UPI0026386C10|nr:hypothetical protein [uncultured Aquimonas sp.]
MAVAAKLAFEASPNFSESELATIAAIQRAHPFVGTDTEALGQWLAGMDEGQIAGVVSNAKGVLHEMEFVRLENEDGDSVHAALFAATNQPGFDIQFMDAATGEAWQAQLKASDSAAYVQAWLDEYPDGEILVTEELAARLDLPGSGLHNAELTARTSDVVDRLQEAGDDDTLWDYFPGLATASIGLVAWELNRRYQRGDIDFARFRWLLLKTTGLKAAKLALLTTALMIPGLNVATGAALVASMIFSGADLIRRSATRPARSA